MKTLLMSMVFLAFMACNSGDPKSETQTSTSEEVKKGEKSEEVDMNGPILEMKVVSFTAPDKTEIEITNRSDEALTSVSGRLVFIDEAGDEITTATGRRKDSPFQLAQNPSVVEAQSRTVFTVRNSIEEGTAQIQITEMKGKTESGATVEP